jgi:hypothetical protein
MFIDFKIETWERLSFDDEKQFKKAVEFVKKNPKATSNEIFEEFSLKNNDISCDLLLDNTTALKNTQDELISDSSDLASFACFHKVDDDRKDGEARMKRLNESYPFLQQLLLLALSADYGITFPIHYTDMHIEHDLNRHFNASNSYSSPYLQLCEGSEYDNEQALFEKANDQKLAIQKFIAGMLKKEWI